MQRLTHIIQCIFLLMVCTVCQQGYAQNDSRLGRFSSDFVTGCAPLSINITINDSFGAVVRQYIYEEGTAETNDTFHTYTNPGTYEIVQIVQSQSPRTDTLTITVFDPLEPTFEIFSCPNNAARVLPTSQHYDFYRVYFGTDSVETLPNELSDIIQFADGTTQTLRIKGFFNGGPGNCGEVSFNYSPANSFQTPEITALDIQQHCEDLIAVNMGVDLMPSVRHQVQYSQNGTDYITLDTVLNQSTYMRSAIPVNTTQVCFRLIALDECTGANVTSEIQCNSDLESNMPSLTDVSATFGTSGIDFSWEALPVAPSDHEVIRAVSGGSFSTLLTTENNSFTDASVSNGNTVYDYHIISSDTCGNGSERSVLIRPVFLRATETATNNYSFSWNNYQGWNVSDDVIRYTLQILNDDLQLQSEEDLSVNDFARNIAADPGRNYRIVAFDQANNRSVFSNVIQLNQQPEIIVPSAFSPNDDTVNDIFLPIVQEASAFRMQIFSRWGELIFISESIFEGWDGKYKRGFAPSGTYIYQISLTDENGRVIQQRGAFILIR